MIFKSKEKDTPSPALAASASPTLDKPFEICRPGTFLAAGGQTVSLSEADLRQIATGYNPKLHRAPLVIGHPKTDDPAFGWVRDMEYRDGALVALAEQVAPDFAQAVQDGRYANRSISFYQPDAATSPTPGRFYLKHVGFLGARAPAVNGLKPVEFNAPDDDSLVIDLAGMEGAGQRWQQGNDQLTTVSLAAFEQRIRQDEQRQHRLANRRREVTEFWDAASNDCLLPIGLKDCFFALAESLVNDDTVISFGEGDDAEQSNAFDLLKRLVKCRGPMVMRGEFAADADVAPGVDLAMPEGVLVDSAQKQLHLNAVAYQKQHNCSYQIAVNAVRNNRR